MAEENHNDKPKDELDIIKEEMAKMREEMNEIKKTRKTDDASHPKPPKSPRPPHPPGEKFFQFKFGEDMDFEGFGEDEIGDTLNDYFGSVMEGVSENLRRSMEDMTRSFRNLEFDKTAHKIHRSAEKAIRKQERAIERAARNAERAARNVERQGRTVRLHPLSPEELEEFLEDAPNILSALTDKRRIQILKILEEGAAYQGDISEKTDTKGGTFKHHMDILLNAKFVHQEATRGRYLITQLGIEGLKLAELLYRRHKFESKRSEYEASDSDADVTIDFDVDDMDHNELEMEADLDQMDDDTEQIEDDFDGEDENED